MFEICANNKNTKPLEVMKKKREQHEKVIQQRVYKEQQVKAEQRLTEEALPTAESTPLELIESTDQELQVNDSLTFPYKDQSCNHY